ncbi:MAG: acetate uptake transporter [Actinomycetota bacterium]|nr:acetate uptake transporter [Actinomycetota bacterium]MDA8282867.1 acetate uptake transporter [Actinomycetota bacterium]
MSETVTNEPNVLTSKPTTVEATVHAPIADPAPIGLAGFAMTTMLLSLVNAHVIGSSAANAVLPLALLYGGAAQLLAGMWEVRNRNTFGALAFTSYGAFWISYYVLAKYWLVGLSAGAVNDAVGFYLLLWGIFTFYMFIASFGTNVAVVSVFLCLFVTFFLLAAGALGGGTGSYFQINEAGGYVGIVTAVLAWYTSFAGVTNATWKRDVVPVFPLSPGRGRLAAH